LFGKVYTFWTYQEYILFCSNLNEIYFRNGWAYFSHMNKIVAGSTLVVRVDMWEEYIGLFVTKLR
jgi:hypothetical protein